MAAVACCVDRVTGQRAGINPVQNKGERYEERCGSGDGGDGVGGGVDGGSETPWRLDFEIAAGNEFIRLRLAGMGTR